MARLPRTHAISGECLKHYHAELSVPQMPATFQQLVKNIDVRIPSTDFWGPRYKFVREALTLAKFTQLMPVTSVRLGEDPPARPRSKAGRGRDFAFEVGICRKL
jgi:hypothetical protein